MTKTYYVCSYGGSGSWMLLNGLKKYGKTEHIHSRYPPDRLEYVGRNNGGKSHWEWFNSIKISDSDIDNYTVIFIYRNPVKAIYSRFNDTKFKTCDHLHHIQSKNKNVKLSDVIKQKKDLFDIESFFDNYTSSNPNRNYEIICVKYEDIFEKQDELSKFLSIGPLNLEKKETNHNIDENQEKILQSIYANTINKMQKLPFIHLI